MLAVTPWPHQRALDCKSSRPNDSQRGWRRLSRGASEEDLRVSVGTAFYPRQRELNRNEVWGEWAGYFAAQVYADFHDIEYSAIREAAAVIDTSPLYKYVVSGADAGRLLDRVVTRDISKLQVDQVFYTPWCDEDGKVLDDGTVTRLATDEYRVTSADPCYRWFLLNATSLDVDIADVTVDLGALALARPC
jgi:aminomethyltransferase